MEPQLTGEEYIPPPECKQKNKIIVLDSCGEML